MPISAAQIKTQVAPNLLAQASGYYSDVKYYIPAINYALKWLVAVINKSHAKTKFSSKVLSEIRYTRVFQTSTFSRVFFDPVTLGHQVLSTIAVHPIIVTTPASPTLTPIDPEESLYRNDISMVTATNPAKRLSEEDFHGNKWNPFQAGNTVTAICEETRVYAYLPESNYNSTIYDTTIDEEITISPDVGATFVAITYLQTPPQVTDITTDILPFPTMFTDQIVDRAVKYIARAQGDNTTLDSVTEDDLAILINVSS